MHTLKITMFWGCVGITFAVLLAMVYSMAVHRQAAKSSSTSLFHKRMLTELIWTFIPFIIFGAMVMPAAQLVMHPGPLIAS